MKELLPWVGWIVAALIGVALVCLGAMRWTMTREKAAATEAAKLLRAAVKRESKTEIEKAVEKAKATIDRANTEALNDRSTSSLADYLRGIKR